MEKTGKKNVPKKIPKVQRLNEPICAPLSFIRQRGTIRKESVASNGATRTERWRTSFMAPTSFMINQTSAQGKEVSRKNRQSESNPIRGKAKARQLRSR